jgi:hypothetical protein
MTGTVLNMRSATVFWLLLYSGSPGISRTHPSPCTALPTLHNSIRSSRARLYGTRLLVAGINASILRLSSAWDDFSRPEMKRSGSPASREEAGHRGLGP